MTRNARYELFDHTADIGVRVFSPTLAGLVDPAGQGLYAAIGDLAATGDPAPLSLSFEDDEPGYLLHDYVAELLHVFDREHRILVALDVCGFDERRLVVTGQTQLLDERRTVLHREVKAVTYHELAVHRNENGYEATFIVDI